MTVGERLCVSSPGHIVSAAGEEEALGFAEEHQAAGIAGAGAVSADQEQVCLLSLKPGIRGAEIPLLAKAKAVFCAKMRDFQNAFIAHCFLSWAPI